MPRRSITAPLVAVVIALGLVVGAGAGVTAACAATVAHPRVDACRCCKPRSPAPRETQLTARCCDVREAPATTGAPTIAAVAAMPSVALPPAVTVRAPIVAPRRAAIGQRVTACAHGPPLWLGQCALRL